MPREDRRIIFNYEEVYKAIYALCAKRQLKKPPPGTLKGISQDNEDKQVIILSVDNFQENTNVSIEYSRDFLAASLMLYCKGEGIPLPKKSVKSVIIIDAEVILRAKM